jgi:hypothetical protein
MAPSKELRLFFSVEKTASEMHEIRITAFGFSSMGGAVIFEWFWGLKFREVANRQLRPVK